LGAASSVLHPVAAAIATPLTLAPAALPMRPHVVQGPGPPPGGLVAVLAAVGGTAVLVAAGGTGVFVLVAAGGTGVFVLVAVGGTAVLVAAGGTGVFVLVAAGGAGVFVLVAVGGTAVLVAAGGTGVFVFVLVAVGGTGVLVGAGGTGVLVAVGVAVAHVHDVGSGVFVLVAAGGTVVLAGAGGAGVLVAMGVAVAHVQDPATTLCLPCRADWAWAVVELARPSPQTTKAMRPTVKTHRAPRRSPLHIWAGFSPVLSLSMRGVLLRLPFYIANVAIIDSPPARARQHLAGQRSRCGA
jgi:hypothetical protein